MESRNDKHAKSEHCMKRLFADKDGRKDHGRKKRKQKSQSSELDGWQENLNRSSTILSSSIPGMNQTAFNQTVEEQTSSDVTANEQLSFLALINLIRNREALNDRKIGAALNFVQHKERQKALSKKRVSSSPYFVASLYEWVQTQISSSCKAQKLDSVGRTDEKDHWMGSVEDSTILCYLDERYWLVFRWCLLSGMQWKAGAISSGIMQAVLCILGEANTVLSRDGLPISQMALLNQTRSFTTNFFLVLLDVLKVLAAGQEGLFSPKLDLWISCVRSCLELTLTMSKRIEELGIDGTLFQALFELILFICRGFAGFSRASPNPRKVFTSVVEKLLEPLLSSLQYIAALENKRMDGVSAIEIRGLMTTIRNILKFSLFHPVHLEGYVNVCKLLKQEYESPNHVSAIVEGVFSDSKAKSASDSMLSYHKLLFDQLDLFIEEGKVTTMGSFAWIFKTYVREIKDQTSSISSNLFSAQVKPDSRIVNKKIADRGNLSSGLAMDSDPDNSQEKKNPSYGLFEVFAELLTPLVRKFKNIYPSLLSERLENLLTLKSLLIAINGLLMVAIEEQVYWATQDTSTFTHLNYLKAVTGIFMNCIITPQHLSAATLMPHLNAETHNLLMAILKESLLGVSHILELEYRVLENDLDSIWKALLFLTTLWFDIAKVHGKKLPLLHDAEISIDLASQVLQIFSELRQIERPILSLCSFLRHLTNADQQPYSDNFNYKALLSIYLSPRFLTKLALLMKAVPVGQTATLVKLLSGDFEETLKFVEQVGVLSLKDRHHSWKAAVKALTEILICAIENANVTASNSIQVEVELKVLLDGVLFKKLGSLVVCGASGGNEHANLNHILASSLVNKLSDTRDSSSASEAAVSAKITSQLTCSSSVLGWQLMLRLYVSLRLIYRKCISLMPHKRAKISCSLSNDFVMSIELGNVTQAAHFLESKGFFALAGLGSVSMAEFLSGIEHWFLKTKQKKVEFLLYTLDCLAMLCLYDVKKQLKAISFLLTERELRITAQNHGEMCSNGEQADGLVTKAKQIKKESKILRMLLKKLSQEASFLANYLTKWIGSIECRKKPWNDSTNWNKVIISLDKQTLPVARWSLLCQNMDIWSEFASENDLLTFLSFLVGKTLFHDVQMVNSLSFDSNISSVTSRLLNTAFFNEQKEINGLLFGILSQEILETLKIFKEDLSLELIISYIERRSAYVAQEMASRNQEQCLENQNLAGEEEHFESSLSDAENRKLIKCISMLKLVGQASKGFLNASSVTKFISLVTELESSLLCWALKTRSKGQLDIANGSSMIEFEWFQSALDLLIASRRSFELLIYNADSSTVTLEDSSLAVAMLRGTCCMYWPLLSVHTVGQYFYHFAIKKSGAALVVDGTKMLISYVMCTTGLFTFVSQKFFKSLSDSLVLKNETEPFPVARGVIISDSLCDLVDMLGAQLGRCSDLVKLESHNVFTILSRQINKDCGESDENTMQEYSFGAFALLGAISSALWSLTSSLECLDEECHSDKEGNTKWVGQLPDKLLTWIAMTESCIITGLGALLLAEDDARNNLAFDCKLEVGKGSAFRRKDGGFIHDSDSETVKESFVDERNVSESDAMTIGHDIGSPEPSAVTPLNEEALPLAEASGHFLQMQGMQLSMIKMMLSGKLSTQSWMLGELFMGMAAIVKLKSLFHSPNVVYPATELCSLQWTAPMQLHVGAAFRILQEVVNWIELSEPSCLMLLAGVIKYLDSIGTYLPYARPTLSSSDFVDLVQLQIFLNGVVLTRIQTTKDVKPLVDIKNSLQSCFQAFMKRPHGLHFHVALQGIERSLLSVQFGKKGENNGLKTCVDDLPPELILLGGLECLVMVLNCVSGTKRLQILSKYTKRFLAAIFHLMRKFQYWLDNSSHSKLGLFKSYKSADYCSSVKGLNLSNPGIALLKCVELLIKFSSREVIFPVKGSHLAQAIMCPATLFKQFCQRNLQKQNLVRGILTASDLSVSKEFGVSIPANRLILEIYEACCKLLRNLLRHRTRECGRCIHLLGESSRALLFFLEIMDLSFEQKPSFTTLNKQSTVQCASWLRRVYEEIAEHRNTLGSYITHFLSDYICIVSGCGMSIRGLSREVEKTLRLGAFALMDVCSTDDLQQLHAVLGEGPRRTTLTALRHDYEKHFKYTGKV